MRNSPFILDEGGIGRSLKSLEPDEKIFSESWLQEAIRKQPGILPTSEIESHYSPLVCIGREVRTEVGPIDNLYMSPNGYLAMVETKLWRNPEAKREVVAQALDYANALSRWNFKKLDEAARGYAGKYEGESLGIIQLIEKQRLQVMGDYDFFIEAVGRNLSRGRFLVLIVGDRIRETVLDVAEYVNRYPGLGLDLALVEVSAHRMEPTKTWPLLFTSRVMKRTEIVERSIVEVTINEGKSPEVVVRQEKPETKEGRRKRIKLSEDQFWELFNQNAPAYAKTARSLIDRFRSLQGVDIDPQQSSLVIKLDVKETGQLASIFFITTEGRIGVWPVTIGKQLASAGLNSALAEEYGERIRKLARLPKNRTDLAASLKSVDLERFATEVEGLLKRIAEASVG